MILNIILTQSCLISGKETATVFSVTICGILTVSIQLPSFSNVYIPNKLLSNCRLLLSWHDMWENNLLNKTTCVYMEQQKTKKVYFP